MKKLYRPLIKGTNWALAGLLTLLGFSCSSITGDDDHEVMYGVPWASHAIKGSVVDKVTGKPIEGIEVKLAIPDSILKNMNHPGKDYWKSITDNNGEYKLNDIIDYIPQGKKGVPVVATDIDGEKNGLFNSDTIYVDTTKGEHIPEEPNKAWFNGEWVSTGNIQLEQKKDE